MTPRSEPPTSASDRVASDGLQRSRESLSLALMDVRNHSLALFAGLDGPLKEEAALALRQDALPEPLWLMSHLAWFQEYWIGRNPQRHLGRNGPAVQDRPASGQNGADEWWGDGRLTPERYSQPPGWTAEAARAYLLESLEQTLTLLEDTPDEDNALHVYRLCLLHEARHADTLVEVAQILGLPQHVAWPGARSLRADLQMPPTRWVMGIDPESPGFSLDAERPAHSVSVPAFEIDAQVVNWAQYSEFVDDGGYERPELWHADGWSWLRNGETGSSGLGAMARRVPRFVEQIGGASGAVLQRRFGQLVRVRGDQAVTHVSWWEADAWCRWAGRRLPAEVEWDLAARSATGRGFHWGDVLEWTGTTARPYPGFIPDVAQIGALPSAATHKVMRGAWAFSRAELRRPSLRRFARPGVDHHFSGFRSCAL